MFNRLFDIEKQVNSLEDRIPDLKEEHKRIFSESLKIAEDIDENPDAKVQLDELNVWLENLEEKVFEY
jgi:chromosome segregation ATPase